MAQKCVHQGCGKTYSDPDEVCHYHPGPPVFHEGQKGWTCCKPRVLTFEEFMDIPPCTSGKHSTTDLPPKIEKKAAPDAVAELDGQDVVGPAVPRAPVAIPTREKQDETAAAAAAAAAAPVAPAAAPPPAAVESDEDDPALAIPDGRVCRRRGCGATYTAGAARDGESCVYHPGAPVFHEGSKGYSCCKRRVLEFDQFMKIEGCQTKGRHLFVGSGGKKKKKAAAAGAAEGTGDNAADSAAAGQDDDDDEELLDTVRFDFYQSATSLTASFFLKKIDKSQAVVTFSERAVDLDLPTTDSPVRKRFRQQVPLYGAIDPAQSKFAILGTKLELTLAKAAVSSWPVLRSTDRPTGEIFQVGRAGKIER